MFGYVRPNLADMSPEAQSRYRSHYCGLCHAIGARHGQAARMALTFDLTYLTVFLGSLYEPEEQTGTARCVPHPERACLGALRRYRLRGGHDHRPDLAQAHG